MGRLDWHPTDEEIIMAYTTSDRTAAYGFGTWVGDFFANLKDAAARRTVFMRVHAELSQMSDRELADIALSRYQIDEIAHQAAYGA